MRSSAPASVPPALFKPPTTYRTNSLGWAKSDCHTCQSIFRFCDRRRPRCDACTTEGVICGGYVQRLRWHGEGRKARPARSEQTLVSGSGACQVAANTTEYAFVQEDGKKIRKRTRIRETCEPSLWEEPVEASPPTLGANLRIGRRLFARRANPIPVLYSRQPEFFQLPSSTLEQLAFFTWRFSPVTLTYEIKANPWQACLPQIDQAPFLLDAVRALAIRHRCHLEEIPEGLSVLELKDRALSSFAQSVSTVPLEVGISMSLILIGTDFAESAFGNWIVYLKGVRRMIEAAGGIQLGDSSMYLRAQITQLVWYDTIIALLSRNGLIFPREDVEYVVSWKSESQWMLALNGFPDSAFLDMYDIAESAAQASSLSAGQATSLEMKLWLARFETEQGAADKEISALTDCWRLGLLLYCTRVFHQGEAVKRKAYLLAEEIMWLVHELPPYSNKQKQTALPLFLAACEMESFRFRRIAMDFCERWKKVSGLWLSQTMIELVQTVWAAVDDNPDKDVWWGDIVTPSSESGFLFG
ncbi:MAG: hypothetical protein Q9165_005667 [Trypethelium subeluteriae]